MVACILIAVASLSGICHRPAHCRGHGTATCSFSRVTCIDIIDMAYPTCTDQVFGTVSACVVIVPFMVQFLINDLQIWLRWTMPIAKGCKPS